MTELEERAFKTRAELRSWLEANHRNSPGIWLRVFRVKSGHQSVSFEDVLELGLCFGWSESKRVRGDEVSYLQCFTPRRSIGTKSDRNLRLAARLIETGEMTDAGRTALGL